MMIDKSDIFSLFFCSFVFPFTFSITYTFCFYSFVYSIPFIDFSPFCFLLKSYTYTYMLLFKLIYFIFILLVCFFVLLTIFCLFIPSIFNYEILNFNHGFQLLFLEFLHPFNPFLFISYFYLILLIWVQFFTVCCYFFFSFYYWYFVLCRYSQTFHLLAIENKVKLYFGYFSKKLLQYKRSEHILIIINISFLF